MARVSTLRRKAGLASEGNVAKSKQKMTDPDFITQKLVKTFLNNCDLYLGADTSKNVA